MSAMQLGVREDEGGGGAQRGGGGWRLRSRRRWPRSFHRKVSPGSGSYCAEGTPTSLSWTSGPTGPSDGSPSKAALRGALSVTRPRFRCYFTLFLDSQSSDTFLHTRFASRSTSS